MAGTATISWIGNTASSSLLNSIVSYWKLDEAASTGTAADSADGNTGTIVNAAWGSQGVAGKIDNGYEFTAANFGTGIDMGSSLTVGTSSWSISLWLKLTGTIGRDYPIQWGADSGVSGIRIDTYADFHGSFIFGWTASYHEQTSGLSTDLSDGNWHNIVLVVDRSGNAQMWIDNVGGTTYDISSHSSDNIANTTNFTVIQNLGVATGVNIDEVGLWNRALTSGEISTLYNSGNGLTYPFS